MDIVYKKLTEEYVDAIIRLRIKQLTEEYSAEGKLPPEDVDLEAALKDFYVSYVPKVSNSIIAWNLFELPPFPIDVSYYVYYHFRKLTKGILNIFRTWH